MLYDTILELINTVKAINPQKSSLESNLFTDKKNIQIMEIILENFCKIDDPNELLDIYTKIFELINPQNLTVNNYEQINYLDKLNQVLIQKSQKNSRAIHEALKDKIEFFIEMQNFKIIDLLIDENIHDPKFCFDILKQVIEHKPNDKYKVFKTKIIENALPKIKDNTNRRHLIYLTYKNNYNLFKKEDLKSKIIKIGKQGNTSTEELQYLIRAYSFKAAKEEVFAIVNTIVNPQIKCEVILNMIKHKNDPLFKKRGFNTPSLFKGVPEKLINLLLDTLIENENIDENNKILEALQNRIEKYQDKNKPQQNFQLKINIINLRNKINQSPETAHNHIELFSNTLISLPRSISELNLEENALLIMRCIDSLLSPYIKSIMICAFLRMAYTKNQEISFKITPKVFGEISHGFYAILEDSLKKITDNVELIDLLIQFLRTLTTLNKVKYSSETNIIKSNICKIFAEKINFDAMLNDDEQHNVNIHNKIRDVIKIFGELAPSDIQTLIEKTNNQNILKTIIFSLNRYPCHNSDWMIVNAALKLENFTGKYRQKDKTIRLENIIIQHKENVLYRAIMMKNAKLINLLMQQDGSLIHIFNKSRYKKLLEDKDTHGESCIMAIYSMIGTTSFDNIAPELLHYISENNPDIKMEEASAPLFEEVNTNTIIDPMPIDNSEIEKFKRLCEESQYERDNNIKRLNMLNEQEKILDKQEEKSIPDLLGLEISISGLPKPLEPQQVIQQLNADQNNNNRDTKQFPPPMRESQCKNKTVYIKSQEESFNNSFVLFNDKNEKVLLDQFPEASKNSVNANQKHKENRKHSALPAL